MVFQLDFQLDWQGLLTNCLLMRKWKAIELPKRLWEYFLEISDTENFKNISFLSREYFSPCEDIDVQVLLHME